MIKLRSKPPVLTWRFLHVGGTALTVVPCTTHYPLGIGLFPSTTVRLVTLYATTADEAVCRHSPPQGGPELRYIDELKALPHIH